ncbi:MAG: FctA domain-containing protein [Eubacteriales bacterium]|nr:FctA domain-containing protein [Eubacteriales bacterium]
MKKLLSIGLAAMLAFGLATTSFAEEARDVTTPTDGIVTIHKVYKLENADTTSPAETFTLVQDGKGWVTNGDATEAPALGTITGATYEEGAATVSGTTGDITVALPEYTNVGVYEYTLKEVDGKTAGVVYYPDDIKLVVTVVNDNNGKLRIAAVHTESTGEAKSDNFPNTYKAGELDVSKTVTGNLGDKNKYFEFKVTLTGEEGKTYRDSYAVTGGSNTENPSTIKIGEETTFLLKHGETIHIENLPYGVTYTVTETAAEGYTTEKTGDTGKINAADQAAKFTNNKAGSIDTGVVLNNMPYILVLAVLAAGVAVFIIRKRRED